MGTSGPTNVLLPQHLKGEERQKAIAEPGPPWKQWFFETGLKPYVALGLLILDSFALVTLEEGTSAVVKWSAVAVIPLLFYLDYVVFAYLWAKPPTAESRRHRKFTGSLLHPFYVGLWNPERAAALERQRKAPATGEVAPEEFL